MITDLELKCTKLLAQAIVEQAVIDYRKALNQKRILETRLTELVLIRNRNKDVEYKILEVKKELNNVERSQIASLERFFRSEWCDFLTGDIIKGERIIQVLKKQSTSDRKRWRI